MINHAFLLLVHNQPNLLRRLLKQLENSNHHFFIHVDKRADKASFEIALSDISNVHFCEKHRACNWGGNNLIWATLDLLRMAKRTRDFGYYHLISGVDAFCSTNSDFDAYFENNQKSYIAKLPNSADYEWRIKIYGLENYLSRRKKWADFICRNLLKAERKILRIIPLRKGLPKEMIFYKGSQWWSLHSGIVQYILDFLEKNRWYCRRFSHTFCSDESFFQTLTYNSPLKDTLVTDNLRYIDWTAKYPNENLPRVLDESDYPAIMASGKFFCRKIDERKSQKLMDLLEKK